MEKNKIKIIILSSIIGTIFLSTVISTVVTTISNENKKDNNDNLIMVNNVLQDITVDSDDDIDLQDENEVIGTLEIPKLELSAPIKEGIEQEILANSIGVIDKDYYTKCKEYVQYEILESLSALNIRVQRTARTVL